MATFALAILWAGVVCGDWMGQPYHSRRGMAAFARWHTDPTPENQARWLAEKARMDQAAAVVARLQLAFGILIPLALLAVWRLTGEARPASGPPAGRLQGPERSP